MSGAWDAMLTNETATNQVWADHGPALAKLQTRSRQANGAVFSSVMWDRGYLTGARDVLGYILGHQNHHFDNLTVEELLTELRKGEGSIYWPIKSADPTLWADCERCRRPVLIDKEGVCPECGHDFEGNT